MTQDKIPWYVPPEWQVWILALAGGVAITQVCKLAYADWKGNRPPTYITVIVAILTTTLLASAIVWAEGSSVRAALAAGLKIGPASPLIWLVARWAARRWAPMLAVMLGEDRRSAKREQKLFGETVIRNNDDA